MDKKIAILGAGGHGKVVGEIALLNKIRIINFFDDNFKDIKNDYPFPVVGNYRDLKNDINKYDFCFVAIGNNKLRLRFMNLLAKMKVNLIKLIHPSSIISEFSSIGRGSCTMAGSVVNAGTIIGEGVIVNTSASIDHDCKIQDFTHIGPNCSLCGDIKIGSMSLIGAGTSIKNSISIGKNVKIGNGSKIFKNITSGQVFKN